jgi:hypothetical protein
MVTASPIWSVGEVTGDNALVLGGTRRTGFTALPSVADTNWAIGGR